MKSNFVSIKRLFIVIGSHWIFYDENERENISKIYNLCHVVDTIESTTYYRYRGENILFSPSGDSNFRLPELVMVKLENETFPDI